MPKPKTRTLSRQQAADDIIALLEEFHGKGGDLDFLVLLWSRALFEDVLQRLKSVAKRAVSKLRANKSRQRKAEDALLRLKRALSDLTDVGVEMEPVVAQQQLAELSGHLRLNRRALAAKGGRVMGRPFEHLGRCVIVGGLDRYFRWRGLKPESWQDEWTSSWVSYAEAFGRGMDPEGLQEFLRFTSPVSSKVRPEQFKRLVYLMLLDSVAVIERQESLRKWAKTRARTASSPAAKSCLDTGAKLFLVWKVKQARPRPKPPKDSRPMPVWARPQSFKPGSPGRR